jgi:hypothetical protein
MNNCNVHCIARSVSREKEGRMRTLQGGKNFQASLRVYVLQYGNWFDVTKCVCVCGGGCVCVSETTSIFSS